MCLLVLATQKARLRQECGRADPRHPEKHHHVESPSEWVAFAGKWAAALWALVVVVTVPPLFRLPFRYFCLTLARASESTMAISCPS